MTNEHEITKNMLNTIRENRLQESDTSIMDLEGAELDIQKDKFQQQAASGGQFKFFKIYPSTRNAVFSGKLDNGIDWQFSRVDGVYFNAPNMELTDKVVEQLRRISTYKLTWDEEWNKKIDEYIGNKKDGI